MGLATYHRAPVVSFGWADALECLYDAHIWNILDQSTIYLRACVVVWRIVYTGSVRRQGKCGFCDALPRRLVRLLTQQNRIPLEPSPPAKSYYIGSVSSGRGASQLAKMSDRLALSETCTGSSTEAGQDYNDQCIMISIAIANTETPNTTPLNVH